MKLADYFERIGFVGVARPDLDTLQRLHRGHLENIPYENLDVLLQRRLDFDMQRIFDKLVTRRRGGWCYEMNGLFAWALEQIGFRVTRMAGAVIRDRIGDALAGNHLVLLVHLDHDYLVDVGFGDGLYEPVALGDGEIIQTGFVSRLEFMDDGWWRFHNHQNCGAPSFDFRAEAGDPATFARVCDFLQTSPTSPFTQNLIFQRRFDDRVEAIRNSFRLTARPQALERRVMSSAEELLGEMRAVFGVEEDAAASLWPLVRARGQVMLREHPL
jgi:N-hydroxyarylamine O-acetyltransferase